MRNRLRDTWSTPAGRGFVMLAVMSAAYGFALNAHSGIVTNFFEDVLRLNGPQFGYITAIREVGGFVLIFLTAALYRVTLQHVATGALVALAIGYFFYGFASSFWTVIPWVVITSFGFHTVAQMQSSLGLSLTTEQKSGAILGRIAAMGQAGTVAALVIMFVIFQFHLLSFRTTFIVLGVVALIGAVAVVRFPHLHEGRERTTAPRREPLVWKRSYRYYYILNILDGARQQIFFSFGLWVLVNRFELDVAHVAVLLLIVAVIAMLASAWVGRTIDRRGEKATISAVNVAYVVALAGFALANHVLLACLFYVIYAFIAPFSSLAATTYLRKVAVPQDVAPSLSMGVTLLHATAIVVPVMAGFILNFVGYQIPFAIACVFALATISVTRKLDPAKQRSPERRALDEAAVVAGAAAPALGEAPTTAEARTAESAAEARALRLSLDGGAGEEIAAQAAAGYVESSEEEPA